jgi:hypothetical protein
MNSFLKEPTASEPDIIDAGLKRQLLKLMASKPRAPVNASSRASIVAINTLSAWKEWGIENKWGLILILSLAAFLYYRWRYCRNDEKPAVLASDFKVPAQDPNYFTPPTAAPMGYGVPATQSNGWRGNGMPMTGNQIGHQMSNYPLEVEPMAANQF